MSQLVVQLLFGGFGLSGLIGAGVALYKLRPDVNSAAVVQAQGAMDAMKELVDSLRADRDEWRARARDCEKLVRDQEREILELKAQVELWSHLDGTDTPD